MELKVACGCGHNYTLDVQPVGGRIPARVSCPVCGADGTETANGILARSFPAEPPPLPIAPITTPPAGALPINAPPPITSTTVAPPTIGPVTRPKTESQNFNMGLGILGAFLGAVVSGALVYGFFKMVGFRFPWSAIGIGALTGYGARLLGRGTDRKLGIIAAALSLVTIVGVFYSMYGNFFLFEIVSIIISVGVAYRFASD